MLVLRRLINRIGRRGAFLIFLALLDLIYGFSLAFPTHEALNSSLYIFLAAVMPIYLWAVLWIGVGVTCLIYTFKLNDSIGYTSAMFLKILWSLMLLLGWMFAGVNRGWIAATIWGAFAAVVWLIAGWPDPGSKKVG